jgi:hypothetical protein
MSAEPCEAIRVELPWVAAASADPEQTRSVARHLAVCPECRVAYAEEIALRDGLRAAEAPTKVPARSWREVEERLGGARSPVLPILEACGAPALMVRALEGAFAADAERSVRDWLRPWVALARAAS